MSKRIHWPTLVGACIGAALRGSLLAVLVYKGTGNVWLGIAAAVAFEPTKHA